MMKALVLAVSFALFALCCPAQTAAPAPTSSTMSFSVGGNALGLGGTTASTPATDITLTLNPGVATKGYLSEVSLLSDNLLAPGANLQYYAGGFLAPIPVKIPSTSPLSGISFYWRATAGVDRIVPASGPSQTHFGLMAGGGAQYTNSSGVKVTLIEVDFLRTPGSPWGANAPAVEGGLSYVFGSH